MTVPLARQGGSRPAVCGRSVVAVSWPGVKSLPSGFMPGKWFVPAGEKVAWQQLELEQGTSAVLPLLAALPHLGRRGAAASRDHHKGSLAPTTCSLPVQWSVRSHLVQFWDRADFDEQRDFLHRCEAGGIGSASRSAVCCTCG